MLRNDLLVEAMLWDGLLVKAASRCSIRGDASWSHVRRDF